MSVYMYFLSHQFNSLSHLKLARKEGVCVKNISEESLKESENKLRLKLCQAQVKLD